MSALGRQQGLPGWSMIWISGGRNKQKMLRSTKTSETLGVVRQTDEVDTTHSRKGPSRPPSADSHGEGSRSSQLGVLGGVSRGKADIPGLLGSTSCSGPSLVSEGAIWVIHCCKCSRVACEDLSQQALPLPSMR